MTTHSPQSTITLLMVSHLDVVYLSILYTLYTHIYMKRKTWVVSGIVVLCCLPLFLISSSIHVLHVLLHVCKRLLLTEISYRAVG